MDTAGQLLSVLPDHLGVQGPAIRRGQLDNTGIWTESEARREITTGRIELGKENPAVGRPHRRYRLGRDSRPRRAFVANEPHQAHDAVRKTNVTSPAEPAPAMAGASASSTT